MKPWSLILVLIPGVLAAESGDFNTMATEQCLAQGGGMDCVGLSAKHCMDVSAGGHTTVGMNHCTDLELGWWDERLNAAYGALRALDQAQDAELPDDATGRVEALRDMQRAWIGFRDAKCAYVAAEWSGGSIAGPATLWCLMDETARQAMYLEERTRQ